MVHSRCDRSVLTILAAGIVVPALPYLLSFAAGAMLYVVVEALIPEMSQGRHSNVGTVFFCGKLQRDDGTGCGTGVTGALQRRKCKQLHPARHKVSQKRSSMVSRYNSSRTAS